MEKRHKRAMREWTAESSKNRVQDSGHRSEGVGERCADTGYRCDDTGYRCEGVGERCEGYMAVQPLCVMCSKTEIPSKR
ncbi:MAG: hypothetical protein FWG82_06135 [Oscillospiraceae bacterium]|nr:hypothetical protein [Oscillospiraceae bacterium]